MNETIEDKRGNVVPLPPNKKIDLHSASSIRREMASVYRDMRGGKIETQDGSKLCYVLELLRKAYETDVLETRVQDVERLLKNRRDNK